MKISIIIPTYNEEKYLPKCLEWLEKLTLKPDEVLVVDGNSTDKTRKIAKKWGAKVIIVKERGIGLARQRGLEAAKGDIVVYTDADTIVPPDWLVKFVETLQHPGVVGVYSYYRLTDGWWPYKLHMTINVPWMIEVHQLFNLPMPPGQNMAFWKWAGIKAGGYPIDFKIGEDIEMARRLTKIGKVAYRRDNKVVSSGRRGQEGWALLWRTTKFYFSYLLFHKVGDQSFPDMR